jgi:hypothetical protein
MSTEKDERIAELEAHIEDLHRSINDLIGESDGVAGLHLNGEIATWGELLEGGRFEGWLLALGVKPDTTSLARRDALKQAEALERVIRVMRQPCTDVCYWQDIQAMADELRRQAEEAP